MVTTIGILGAGRVGSAIARRALDVGYEVNIAASGPASEIDLLVDVVVPGARAMTAADAVAGADLVILAIPLHKYRTVPSDMLAGKIVIDAMNYWEPTDGRTDDFETGARSSEVIRDHFAAARVVKTLNHIGYHEIETDARPLGHDERRALAVVGDDEDAVGTVAEVIERLGFDAVPLSGLSAGTALEPGGAIFGARHDVDALRAVIELSTQPSL